MDTTEEERPNQPSQTSRRCSLANSRATKVERSLLNLSHSCRVQIGGRLQEGEVDAEARVVQGSFPRCPSPDRVSSDQQSGDGRRGCGGEFLPGISALLIRHFILEPRRDINLDANCRLQIDQSSTDAR
jgi:hypothetical protein